MIRQRHDRRFARQPEGFTLVDLGASGARYQIANGDYVLVLDLDDDGDLFVDVFPGDDPDGELAAAGAESEDA